VQKAGCSAAVACAGAGTRTIRLPRAMRRATVYVNGKRVKTIRGRHSRVRLEVAKTSKVRIAVRLASGKRTVIRKTYRVCG
jgi:hypothetical protein